MNIASQRGKQRDEADSDPQIKRQPKFKVGDYGYVDKLHNTKEPKITGGQSQPVRANVCGPYLVTMIWSNTIYLIDKGIGNIVSFDQPSIAKH